MKRFLRSKLVLSLVAMVMIATAVAIPLSSNIIRSHAAGPSSLKDNVPPSTIAADPFNARLAIQVGTDGRFNIGAFPDPSTGGATSGSWDLMYSWPSSPGTSYSTLNIDGSNSIYGSSGTQIQAPQDTDAKTNQSSWQVGDIQASQTLQLALNDQTGQEDNAKIAYSLTNNGTIAHTVGFRIMIDTEVNGNDGAILRVPGTGLVTKESEFTGANVPDTMQSFFDVTDNQHVAAVTLKSGGATPPDRLVIASWPHLYNNVYDYTIDPNFDFTDPSVARPDSGYAVYWNPVSLAPGQSLNYVTYYGLSQLNVNLTPPLALGVSGPATLSVINNAYSPNPFTIAATVLNNGTADATNVALTLHLPTGLSLSSGTATQNIGTLPVGQERDVSWSVQTASQTSQQTLTYSVDAVATNTPVKTVEKQITLPALSALCQISPSGLNTCHLQKGDILLLHSNNPLFFFEASLFAGYWTHAGIYNGDGTITESYPKNGFPDDTPGVVINPVAQSSFWNQDVTDWAVLRVNSLNATQQGNAVAYAESKADGNHHYNYDFPDKLTELKFYCSQLVWRAYENQGVDLDSHLSSFGLFAKTWLTPLGLIGQPLIANAVPPDDIYFSHKASIVEERPGAFRAAGRWILRLLSPGTLLVTDPQGRRTGYDPVTKTNVQEIPGTFYNGPGTEPQFINFEDLIGGTWKFQVTGTGNGSYALLGESINRDTHTVLSAPGTITPGATVTYQFSNPGDGTQPLLTQIVSIDIKPGNDPAAINPGSKGVTPVAILSTNTFDATTVDPTSVKFGSGGAGSTQNSFEDVNGDGKLDLVLHFSTQQAGIKIGDTQVCLTGKTKAGINIQGCDNIVTS